MAAAGNIVVESPPFEDNPVEEFQGSVPHGKEMQTSKLESTDLTKSQVRKHACSRVALALIAGAFVIAAAGATAAVVGTSLLKTSGSDSSAADSSIAERSESGSTGGGVSGSFVLRAENVETLAGDDRFSLALATAVASTLASQTGGTISAGDVQVSVATRRLGATPSLRAHARRLEEDYIFVDYIVLLQGKDSPDPEAATQALLATDPAAMTAQIEAEMTSQGLEQGMRMEVISISADVASGEAEVVALSQAQDDPDTNVGPFNGAQHEPLNEDRCYKHFGSDKQKCDQAGRLCVWSDSKCITPTEPTTEDGCYEKFGSSKEECLKEKDECQWIEDDGDGKCMMIVDRNHSEAGHWSSGEDECYEEFGSNKTKCLEAGEDCQWFEDDGDGKCIEKWDHGGGDDSSEEDECYEEFGSNKTKCLEAGEHCQWFEVDGDGICMEKVSHHGGDDDGKEDGCYEKFGSNKDKCLKKNDACQWVENDGDGKCIEKFGHHGGKEGSGEEDECYEHFGSDKDKCLEAGEDCQWFEEDGDGKCIENWVHKDGKEDECFEHFGSNKDECLEAGEDCQWVDDDGDGKCIETRGPHGETHPKKPCAKFGSEECSGTDGLCEWVADTNSTNGTCVPTFAYLDVAEVQEAACELKDEGECTEANVCGWFGGTCKFSNFTDVCKDLFGTDADRCLQQEWLCAWAQTSAGEEAACTMKLPGREGHSGEGSGHHGPGGEQGEGCQRRRRRRRRPSQGGHGGGGYGGGSYR